MDKNVLLHNYSVLCVRRELLNITVMKIVVRKKRRGRGSGMGELGGRGISSPNENE